MLVTIDDIALTNNEIFVKFSTTVGFAVAEWHGPCPKFGEQYDVELDIDAEFVWGKNICVSLSTKNAIEASEDCIHATGTLLRTSPDGHAIIDLAGSIVLIELLGYASEAPVFVDLQFNKLTIYPTNL